MSKPVKLDHDLEQPIEITLEIMRHKNKVSELEYERTTERMKHEWAQERHRIMNAESKKRDMANLERDKELILFRRDNWIKKDSSSGRTRP